MTDVETQSLPGSSEPPSKVGAAATCCALAWLTAEFVGEPAAYIAVSFLILTIVFIPTSKRRRPWIAVFGAIATGACMAGLFVVVLSGLSGPWTIWLMVAVMAILGLAVPLVFALTFPNSDTGELG